MGGMKGMMNPKMDVIGRHPFVGARLIKLIGTLSPGLDS
jgi:hypothetical protein